MKIVYLGVEDRDPIEYVSQYGPSLFYSYELPDYVKDIKTPAGIKLAADCPYIDEYELEGDFYALSFIDLAKEGLIQYKRFLQKMLII